MKTESGDGTPSQNGLHKLPSEDVKMETPCEDGTPLKDGNPCKVDLL